jgi:hypothetical protein
MMEKKISTKRKKLKVSLMKFKISAIREERLKEMEKRKLILQTPQKQVEPLTKGLI